MCLQNCLMNSFVTLQLMKSFKVQQDLVLQEMAFYVYHFRASCSVLLSNFYLQANLVNILGVSLVERLIKHFESLRFMSSASL